MNTKQQFVGNHNNDNLNHFSPKKVISYLYTKQDAIIRRIITISNIDEDNILNCFFLRNNSPSKQPIVKSPNLNIGQIYDK